MIINIIFDSSVSSAPAGFTGEVQQAATILQNTFIDNITVNIRVGWGEIGGDPITPGANFALGGPSNAGTFVDYATLRSWLQADSTSSDDSTAVGSLSGSNPSPGNNWYVASSQLRALGHFTGANSAIDGQIGFGTGWTGGFVGGALHELTHAMGRTGGEFTAGNPFVTVFDLFRWSSPGVHQFFEGAAAYFSINGGQTRLANFGQNSDTGDYLNDALLGDDPFGETVTSDTLTVLDIRTMDVLGFNIGGSPTPNPNPTITGTTGNDTLNGTEGPDTMVGLAGADSLAARGGNDLMFGNQQNDTLDGSFGNNTMVGGQDNDSLYSENGNDLVFGNEGNDTVNAWPGNDSVVAGQGNDSIWAPSGNSQQLFGSEGADTVNASGTGPSTIVGGVDSLDAGDSLVGGGGSDLIFGNGRNDSITSTAPPAPGGVGNDTMVGGAGNDSILTGGGNDNIFANENNDTVNAGDGANAVVAGLGDDSILTGGGADTLIGSEGNDTLAGGAGADRYVFATASGNDQVNGFNFSQGDRLSVLGQTFTTQTSADGDVVVVLSGGGRVELNGIAPSAFSASFVI